MPKHPWRGYGRFCPLARGLDVIGDRWTLVIVQELLKRPSRYGRLVDRLPGIGTSLLSDRLRRLEAAGVVRRSPGAPGEGVLYELTDYGRELEEPLRALRRWGSRLLFDPTADGGARSFDVSYVEGIEALDPGEFELIVDERRMALSFREGRLLQREGAAEEPELVVRTGSKFLERWAAGDADWDSGREEGEVAVEGSLASWPRWLAATGYLLRYEPEGAAGADG